MRTRAVFVALVVAGILGALIHGADAATLSWAPPTTGVDTTDGSMVTLTPAQVASIVYIPYVGPSATGPWTAQPTTAPGATSATVPTPAKGETLWYTVAGRLDAEGGKASPVSLAVSPAFLAPSAPTNTRVVK